MFEDIAQSIEQQDYTKARKLIHPLKPQDRDHPWLLFYSAQVQQATGDIETARTVNCCLWGEMHSID